MPSRYAFYVSGTAHPSIGGAGITFSKTDGRPLGLDMLRDTESEGFRQLLKQSLRQWLANVVDEHADTDEQLKEYLFAPQTDPNALPLPEGRPYLTEQGVVLPYEECELTPMREPALLMLPYEQVKPYMDLIFK